MFAVSIFRGWNVLLLALVLAAAAASQARAEQVGSVVIKNETTNTLTFQFQLSGREWIDYDVKPNTDFAIHFEVRNGWAAGTPRIRFDYIAGDNYVTTKQYDLEFYLVNTPNYWDGKPYRFEYNSDGTRLDLYKAD